MVEVYIDPQLSKVKSHPQRLFPYFVIKESKAFPESRWAHDQKQ